MDLFCWSALFPEMRMEVRIRCDPRTRGRLQATCKRAYAEEEGDCCLPPVLRVACVRNDDVRVKPTLLAFCAQWMALYGTPYFRWLQRDVSTADDGLPLTTVGFVTYVPGNVWKVRGGNRQPLLDVVLNVQRRCRHQIDHIHVTALQYNRKRGWSLRSPSCWHCKLRGSSVAIGNVDLTAFLGLYGRFFPHAQHAVIGPAL